MTPERWQRIESLATEALDRDLQGRSAFLAEACGNDTRLARDVRTFMDTFDRVEDSTELATGKGHGRAPANDSQVEWVRVGPYRILREIGQGGMATVYLAERDDREFEKQVAIKLIHPGQGWEGLARRFRSERQILANLDHPNVARLLDGGSTEEGRPYLVMEYIEGLRIDEFCDRSRLTVRQRVELFLEVCAAVQYAHRNLVVHRDIKPGNILVTHEGVPKLLDFGIAKLLDPTDFPHTVEITRSGLRPLTPPYASPEQIRGQTITTAADVYSLGVLLYKLLTGHLPFRFSCFSIPDLELARRTEPAKPSLVVASSQTETSADSGSVSRHRGAQPQLLERQLAGDLDNIVLKALRHEPERRYGSAEQLSEDLRRHLEGLPVIARHASFRYRTGKFIKRNRITLAISSLIFMLVTSFAVQSSLQSRRLQHQRDQAQLERDKARQVSGALVDLFKVLDPSEGPGNTVTVKKLLDKGIGRLARKLNDQPEVQATLWHEAGKIYDNLGELEQAEFFMEKALADRIRLYGNEHLDVATTLTELGSIDLANGQTDRAERRQLRALEMRQRLLRAGHPDFLQSYRGLAVLYKNTGNFSKSIEFGQIALELSERHRGPGHIETALALESLAESHAHLGDFTRAEDLLLRSKRTLEGQEDMEIGYQLIGIHDSLAFLYFSTGHYVKAEASAAKALALSVRYFGEGHSKTASNLNSLGLINRELGRYNDAANLFLESIEVNQESNLDESSTGRLLLNLGDTYRRQGKYDLAIATYQKSLSLLRSEQEETDLRINFLFVGALTSLGMAQVKQGNTQDGKSTLEEALSLIEPITRDSKVPRRLQTHVSALLYLGRIEEARPEVEALLELGWKRTEFLELCREHGFLPPLPSAGADAEPQPPMRNISTLSTGTKRPLRRAAVRSSEYRSVR